MTPAAKLRRYLAIQVKALGGETRCYTSPGRQGMADVLVWLPGGKVKPVEIKAGADTIKPLQRKEAETMARLGHITYFVHDKRDIDEALR